jgi:TSS9, PorZ, N-terminal beta-propeller domain/Two component regulator propeller
MRIIPVIPLLFLLAMRLPAQTPVGSWSDHLSYNTATGVAVGTNEVYASTGSSLLVYNKDYNELKKISRINGLTGTGISAISWSEQYKTLVIGYNNTNVDLLKDNSIINIPDILQKYIPGNKAITRIRTNGKYAYLACSFGIVVIDLNKKEVYDTWKPGPDTENTAVLDITFGADKIYAATDKGVYSASLSSQGLSYSGNWQFINILPDPHGKYTTLIYSGDRLFVNKSDPLSSGDSIFAIAETASLLSHFPGVINLSMDMAPAGFTVSSRSSVRYYSTSGTIKTAINSFGAVTPDIAQAIADNNDIWIADTGSGLIRGRDMSDFSVLSLPGPVSNDAFSITSYNGQTVICGGGTDPSWNNLNRPLRVSLFRNNGWTSLTGNTAVDPVRALIDHSDENHLFVSSWGGGLLEYRNNNLVNHYTETNSPLTSIIPGKPYSRISGLAMDKAKNLWMTQSGVPGSLKGLRPDGTWIVNPITIDAPSAGELIITRAGHKWIILPGGYGLFILDDNNTPDQFNDDRYKKIVVMDAENQPVSSVFSIAEDLDGNIWIGTGQGPLIYYNPQRVFDENIKANRIKIPRNDGSGLSDYLLKTETITSIAVDGANRKWLGTSGSGAYFVAPDGTSALANFNEKNSPLLSDSIISLAVDNKTGDVWFGTSKGIQSFRGNATTGGEHFSNIYAFPNPVRENFAGNVTISGLVRDTQINITDISGNLVYKTMSDGGEATWDLKTYNGKRVATGVYLIFCASSDGSEAFVTKILVIR